MADIASLLLRVTGNSQDAKRALKEVRDELRGMAAEEYATSIEVNGIAASRTQLRNLEKSLDVLQARTVSAKVKVDIGDAREKLAILRRELELAGRGGAGARPVKDILGDIGSLGGDIDRINSKSGILRRTFASLGGAVTGTFGIAMSTGNRALQSFLVNLGRMGITVAFLIPVVSALLGVIGALGASFAFAAAGVGLLAIAFGVALLPVIAVAAAGLITLVRAGKAMQDQQEKERVAAEGVASARDTLRGANERAEEATRSLEQAQDSLASAAVEANRDWAASIEKVKDDLLAVQYAQLGISQSNLNVKKAAQELKDALAEGGLGVVEIEKQFRKFTDVDYKGGINPSGALAGASNALDIEQKRLDYRRALLDQKQAQDTLGDSKRQLNEDRAVEADYLARGIMANEGYRQALLAVEDAQRAQAKATDAQTTANRKLEGALARQKKVVEEFDPATKRLADRMEKLKDTIVDTFGPLGSQIGNAALGMVEDIFEVLRDPEVKENLGEIADAIVEMLEEFGGSAKSERGISFFRRMTGAAAGLARTLGRDAFVSFVKLMARLAEATFPYLLRAARRIADAFDDWEKGARNTDRLRNGIRRIMRSLRDWWDLIKSVARVFLAFVRDGKNEGDNLVRTLTRMFNRLARFLETEEGRKKVIKWLKDSIEFAKDFGKFLKDVYDILKLIVDVVGKAIEGYRKLKGLKDAVQETRNARRAEQAGQDTDVRVLQDLVQRVRTNRDGRGGGLDDREERQTRTGIRNITQNLITRLREAGLNESQIENFLRRAGVTRSGGIRRAWGGIIPGAGGFGDDTNVLAEGGEYMLRRSVVANIGVRNLDALNSGVPLGRIAARSGGGGGGNHIEKIILPPAPAAEVQDARYQAVELGKELTRRGG